MATNSTYQQLNLKNKLSKQPEQEQDHRGMKIIWRVNSWEGNGEEWGEVQGLRSTIGTK